MTLLFYDSRDDSATAITDAETLFTSDSISLDGSTRIMLEVFASNVDCSNGDVIFHIYQDASNQGRLTQLSNDISGANFYGVYGAQFLTPSAGDYVYTVVTEISASTALLDEVSWFRITTAPATELAYVERTTNFTGTNPFATTGALTFDGATRIRIDVCCGTFETLGDAEVDLLDNGSSIGTFGEFGTSELFHDPHQITTMFLSRYLTPSAGSHTFSVEISGGTPVCYCGTTRVPGFLRVTYG